MGTLPHDLIAEIHSTAMDAGLSADREALLTGHLRHLEGSIPTASAPAAQLLCDLSTLNDWPDPVDGAPAIAAWLRWAICLRQTLPHVQSVFRRALDQAHGASASSRPGPEVTWLHVGAPRISDSWMKRPELVALILGARELNARRRIDFVFVTGDLTAGGTAEELDHAWHFLEALCGAIDLPSGKRLFLSPGERDLSPAAASSPARTVLIEHLRRDDIDLVGRARDFLEESTLLTKPLERYFERLSQRRAFTTKGAARAWRATTIDSVAVGELCGVWSATRDSPFRVLGVSQVDEVWRAARGTQVRFLLNSRRFDEFADSDVVHRLFQSVPAGWGSTFLLCAGPRACVEEPDLVSVSTGPSPLVSGALEACLGHHDMETGATSIEWYLFEGRTGREAEPRAVERIQPVIARPTSMVHQSVAEVIRDGVRTRCAHPSWGAVTALPFAGESAPPGTEPRASFVPPQLEDYPLERGAATRSVHSLDDILHWLLDGESRSVVAFGEPGSGKSTVALQIASAAASHREKIVPILLQLRFIGRTQGDRRGILEAIQSELRRLLGVSLKIELIESILRDHRCLLIADGLDHMEQAGDRASGGVDAFEAFQTFAAGFPRLTCFLTSRIRPGAFRPPEAARFVHVRPFSRQQIDLLVQRWFASVERDAAVAARRAEQFRDLLCEKAGSSPRLAMTPLLVLLSLAMYSAAGNMPGRRAKLYDAFVSALLDRRRPADALAAIEPELQRRYLEDLAHWMLSHDKTSVSSADAVAALTRMLENDVSQPATPAVLATRLLRHFSTGIGVLSVDGEEVRFAQPTIFEYLAGQGFLRHELPNGYSQCSERICERVLQDRWREPLLLMLGSDSAKVDLSSLVALRLLQPQGTGARDTTLLFVFQMLRDGVYLDKRALECVPSILKRLRIRTQAAYLSYFLREPAERAERAEPESQRAAMSTITIRNALGPLVLEARAAMEEIAASDGRYGQAIRSWTDERLRDDALRIPGPRTEEDLLTLALTLPAALLGRARLTELRTAIGPHVVPLFLNLWPYEQVGRRAREIARPGEIVQWVRSQKNIELVAPWSLVFLREGWTEGAAAWTIALLQRSAWLQARTLRWEPPPSGPVENLEIFVGELRSGYVRLGDSFRFFQGPPDVQALPGRGTSISKAVASRALTDLTALLDDRLASSSDVRELSGVFRKSYLLNLPHQLCRRFRQERCADMSCFAAVLKSSVDLLAQVYPARICRTVKDHLRFRVAKVPLRPKLPSDCDLDLWNLTSSPDSVRDAWDHALLRHLIQTAVGALQASTLAAESEGKAGSLAGGTHEHEAWRVSAIRAQNWWVHLFWDSMFDEVPTARPEERWGHDALLLALGLAQYQTTWQWPPSQRWRAMLDGAPPRDWLGRCAWHLCWMVSSPAPTRREHARQFQAALDTGRAEWPDLVQELERYCLAAPTFDG